MGWPSPCARSDGSSGPYSPSTGYAIPRCAAANAGLNKGEARNALARAIFFHRLGELRDRSFENQVYRASGLNLLVAAVILWNTRYLEAAFDTIGKHGNAPSPALRRHVAPLGWEHISLTGDYIWSQDAHPDQGLLRPLRTKPSLLAA